MSSNESLRIDAEHPWPWLDAFPESAQAFFNGREAATAQLLRCVLAAPATVLFGKSGLGKTSLLQAGLFPLLRAPERRLLPVLVRLDHGADRPGLSAQLLARLRTETQAHQIAWEHPALPNEDSLGDTARLWELLHDSRTQWRDAEGRRWTPVFVLDQFEEVFTLVAEVEAQQRLFDELGNLVQGRIPAEVAARLDAHDELLERIDPDKLGARFVLSLREDYLPDLEIHADRIPRLGPNRYRLLPMSRKQALEAIGNTGGALVDGTDAERIVDFLDQQNQSVDNTARPRRHGRQNIEPALLSLVCAGLNRHRLSLNPPGETLDTRSLDTLGGQLLENFYDDAFATLPADRREAACRFVETELITADGTRRPFPETALHNAGLDSDELRILKDQRLLRTENTEHGAYIELVHDRMATVVAQRALRSRERLALAAKNRKLFGLTISFVLVSFALISVTWLWLEAKSAKAEAETAKAGIEIALEKTESAKAAADSALTKATFATALAEQRTRELTKEQIESQNTRDQKAAALDRALIAEKNSASESLNSAIETIKFKSYSQSLNPIQHPSHQAILNLLASHKLSQKYLKKDVYTELSSIPEKISQLNWIWTSHTNSRVITISENGLILAGQATGEIQYIKEYNNYPINILTSSILYNKSIKCISISKDKKMMAIGGFGDNSVIIADLRSGNTKFTQLTGHAGPIYTLAFSDDGSMLASGGPDKFIKIWNTNDWKEIISPPEKHKGNYDLEYPISVVLFSPDGKYLISGGHDGVIQIWDLLKKKIHNRFTGHPDRITAIKISSDGKRIASSSIDGTLITWTDLDSLKSNWLQKAHPGTEDIAMSSDGNLIASSGFDGKVKIWSWEKSNTPVNEIKTIHNNGIENILFSPNDANIIILGSDHTISSYNYKNAVTGSTSTHNGNISSIKYSPDGKLIASGGYDCTLKTSSAIKLKELNKIYLPHNTCEESEGNNRIDRISFNAGGNQIATGSLNGTVALIDVKNNQVINQYTTGASVRSVAFSPTDNLLATGGTDGNIRIFNTKDPTKEKITFLKQLPKEHTSFVSGLAFSPDGNLLASSGLYDGKIILWDFNSNNIINQVGGQSIISNIAFSHDGKNIASAGMDRTIKIWPSEKLVDPILLKGHKDWIKDIAFSPDDKYIASVGNDGALILWDWKSKEIKMHRNDFTAQLSSIAYHPSGKFLAVGDASGSIYTIPIGEGLVDSICSKISHNMSRAEWKKFISDKLDYEIQCPGKPIKSD